VWSSLPGDDGITAAPVARSAAFSAQCCMSLLAVPVCAEQGLASVHLSVRLFHPAVKCRCCKFAAGGPVGRKYRLIAAWPAHSSSCAAAVAYGGQTWGVPRCQLT